MHFELLAKDRMECAGRYRAEYLVMAKEMRGAHKGIWRLKQKIKRLERETQP